MINTNNIANRSWPTVPSKKAANTRWSGRTAASCGSAAPSTSVQILSTPTTADWEGLARTQPASRKWHPRHIVKNGIARERVRERKRREKERQVQDTHEQTGSSIHRNATRPTQEQSGTSIYHGIAKGITPAERPDFNTKYNIAKARAAKKATKVTA